MAGRRGMREQHTPRNRIPMGIQTMIPAILTVVIFFVATFTLALPFVRDNAIASKRQMICELTDTVWNLLHHYHMRVQSGELTRAESQSRAVDRIRAMRYGPDTRDYFWINDVSGRMILHPQSPQLEDQNVLQMTDSTGKPFMAEILRIAGGEGNGFIDYTWPSAHDPSQFVPRIAYVRLFEPWGWVIGTGLDVADIEADIDRVTRRLWWIFGGGLTILGVMTIWLVLLNRASEKRRREAEEQLRESEEQHRSSLDNMLSGFVLLEPLYDESGKPTDARVIQVNPAALQIGNLPLDPTGRMIRDLFPAVADERLAHIDQVVSTGQSTRLEQFFPEFGRWLEILAFSPQPNRFAITFTDITERKSAEQALTASEQRFRNLVEASPDGIWEIDAEARYTYCSPQYKRLLGYEPQEMIGLSPFDLCPPEEVESIRNDFNQYARDHRPFFNFRNPCLRKDGSTILFETSGIPVFDEKGKFHGYRGVDRDSTERIQIEEALRKNEQQLRLIVENAIDIISSHAPDSTIRYISPSCRSLLGYEPEELLGRKAAEISHPEDAAKIRQLIQDAAQIRNSGFRVEHRIRRKEDRFVWCETHARLLFDETGELTEIQCSIRDITERRKNEEALRILNSRYQAILSAIPDIVTEVDINKRYTWVNPAGKEFFGDDVVGHFAQHYFVGEQNTYQIIEPLFNGDDRTVYVESWQRRKDGKRRLLAWWCRPLKDSLGRVIGALSTAHDITESQQAHAEREQLLKTLELKNVELQNLVYIASHDLRSPLVNIQGFGGELERVCSKLDALTTQLPDGPNRQAIRALLTNDMPECLYFVKAGTEKINQLLDGLLRLSRVGTAEVMLESVDMDEVLRQALFAIRYQIQQHGVAIHVDTLPSCLGDGVLINQLFSNLIDNAIKYSEPSRPCRIRISGRIEGSQVVYQVNDNGIGIEPEYHDAVFQLFYRLHPSGNMAGEGLGLTIVKRILDRLNGTIRLESVPGQGTTFFITLPGPENGE